jgi:phthalate 4,5-dioxygenase
MLSHEDNELLCRVGPGTLMGDLFRQYWLPAMQSEELPEPDCDQVRVLLLGEELIGFRDSNGNIGLVENSCPHRGASLYYARNEDCGLRCIYHGWKFDVNGNCVDMPNEPAQSNFKDRVKAVAYPTVERGGIIWTYMGPRSTPPPLPDLEGNMAENSMTYSQIRNCNWMQALEGDIDTVHFSWLHVGHINPEDAVGDFMRYQVTDPIADVLGARHRLGNQLRDLQLGERGGVPLPHGELLDAVLHDGPAGDRDGKSHRPCMGSNGGRPRHLVHHGCTTTCPR